MTTQLTPPTTDGTGAPPRRQGSRTLRMLAVLATVAAPLIAIAVSRTGPSAERIANPNVTGAPRPVEPLFGFDHWIMLHQVGLILMMITIVTGFVIGWRRRPAHPILLMVLATTLLVWQDPIMNWAPYAVYNPQLWHWPETWPLVSLSPTVEPFIVIGYASFYMLPFFPAVWILRRIQARRPIDSFLWRHPLLSLSALILAIGFVFDAALEIFLVRTQLYIYSHVIPWGSYAAGKWYQFPLLWESVLVSTVMIPAGVLLYRDDTGRTQAEKLSQKLRWFRSRPALGTFAVMFAIINFTYFFLYGGAFALMKDTRSASSVACPWPYPEAKVYDPQGFYEEAGQPGPYFPGIWSQWQSGQPDGRPDVKPPAGGGRCGE